MKLSVRTALVVALLLAAIGYTIFNWVTGSVDSNTAILYILVLSFPMVRMLSAFVQKLKDSSK